MMNFLLEFIGCFCCRSGPAAFGRPTETRAAFHHGKEIAWVGVGAKTLMVK
ncbi:MAG TPA: hypothetical protein VF643_02875 [Sphingomonas sp.]|jgi:hypothetical protein